MRNVITSYMDTKLEPQQRLEKCWYSTFMLRIWRKFVFSKKGLTLKNNFLSLYSHACIELNALSLVHCINQLKNNDRPNLFQTTLFESQHCENLFRQVRSFTSTYSMVANCSVKEILGRISKIQHQSDIMTMLISNFNFPRLARIQSKHQPILFSLPTNDEIKKTIEKSKNDALRDAVALGLVDKK